MRTINLTFNKHVLALWQERADAEQVSLAEWIEACCMDLALVPASLRRHKSPTKRGGS